MQLTPFGLHVRKLRIEKGLRLKDMADYTKVSSSFLSAVEFGREEIPESLIATIFKMLNLKQQEQTKLQNSAEQSKKAVRADVDNDNLSEELAAAFKKHLLV